MAASTASGEGATSDCKNEHKYPIGDLFNKYIPYAGGASTLLFSINVMQPGLYRRLFSPFELTVSNCLWFNAHLGTGLYIYNRPMIQQASPQRRIAYSVFGAMIFNFGTVLFWATTKAILPENNFLRTVFGIGTGIALLYTGRDYLEFIDSQPALK